MTDFQFRLAADRREAFDQGIKAADTAAVVFRFSHYEIKPAKSDNDPDAGLMYPRKPYQPVKMVLHNYGRSGTTALPYGLHGAGPVGGFLWNWLTDLDEEAWGVEPDTDGSAKRGFLVEADDLTVSIQPYWMVYGK